MTQKQAIIDIFKLHTTQYSCRQVCKILLLGGVISYDPWRSVDNLSASVSSQLKKLVTTKVLKVVEGEKGPRGGMVYKKR